MFLDVLGRSTKMEGATLALQIAGRHDDLQNEATLGHVNSIAQSIGVCKAKVAIPVRRLTPPTRADLCWRFY